MDSDNHICKVNARQALNWAEAFLDNDEKISGKVTIDVYPYQGERQNLRWDGNAKCSSITIDNYQSTNTSLESTPQPTDLNASLGNGDFVLSFKQGKDKTNSFPYMYQIIFSVTDGKECGLDAYTYATPYPTDLMATGADDGTITIPVTDYCRRTIERKLDIGNGGELAIKVRAKSNAHGESGQVLYKFSDWTTIASSLQYQPIGSVEVSPVTGFDYSAGEETKTVSIDNAAATQILNDADKLKDGERLVLEVKGGTETEFGRYTDVTPFQLNLKVVSETADKQTTEKSIAETKKAIKITVPIPAALQDAKNIIVLRKHNNIITQLFVDEIKNGNISFYTDMFSDYALVADNSSEPSGYSVIFNANDGSGSMDALTNVKGEVTLTKNTFTRTGYTFTGWNTSADGKGTSYTDGQSVTLSGDLTLYAQWQADAAPSTSGGGPAAPAVDRTKAANTVSDATTSAKSAVSDAALSTAAKDLAATLIDQAKEDADKNISAASSTTAANTAATNAEAAIKEITDRVEKAEAITDITGSGDQKDAVQYGIVKGYIQGTSDTTFSPNGNVTRAQFVTFLYRLAGSPAVSGTLEFNDVKDNANLGGGDFAAAIQWASDNGIANGFGDGSFKPGDPVTREQVVAFLHRYFTSISGGETNDFADVKDGAWYEKDISWGVGAGIVNGISATEFGVGNDTTRAQAAQFIYRAAVK